MARNLATGKLHLLSVREVLAAGDGEFSDGGGLRLRVKAGSAVWVFRFTARSGRRREMGLGAAHRASSKQVGEGLVAARRRAQDARELLGQGIGTPSTNVSASARPPRPPTRRRRRSASASS